MRLGDKTFCAVANRHDGECYGPVLDTRAGNRRAAYLRVDGTREALMIQDGPPEQARPLVGSTYCGRSPRGSERRLLSRSGSC